MTTVSEGEEPNRRVVIVPVEAPTGDDDAEVPAGATAGDGPGEGTEVG